MELKQLEWLNCFVMYICFFIFKKLRDKTEKARNQIFLQ